MPREFASATIRSSRSRRRGIVVLVVERAEELLLAGHVAAAAIAADADAEDARPAALALGLQHAIEDALVHAVEIAAGADAAVGQAVLRAHVLAAAALEDQLHLEAAPARLVEVV